MSKKVRQPRRGVRLYSKREIRAYYLNAYYSVISEQQDFKSLIGELFSELNKDIKPILGERPNGLTRGEQRHVLLGKAPWERVPELLQEFCNQLRLPSDSPRDVLAFYNWRELIQSETASLQSAQFFPGFGETISAVYVGGDPKSVGRTTYSEAKAIDDELGLESIPARWRPKGCPDHEPLHSLPTAAVSDELLLSCGMLYQRVVLERSWEAVASLRWKKQFAPRSIRTTRQRVSNLAFALNVSSPLLDQK